MFDPQLPFNYNIIIMVVYTRMTKLYACVHKGNITNKARNKQLLSDVCIKEVESL